MGSMQIVADLTCQVIFRTSDSWEVGSWLSEGVMKKAESTKEQIVKILRDADRAPVAEMARSTVSVTRRSTAGGSGTAPWSRGRRQAAAAARAGERPAEKPGRGSGSEAWHDAGDQSKAIVAEQVRRRQMVYARRRGLSSRRACALLAAARLTWGYQSRLAIKDGLSTDV